MTFDDEYRAVSRHGLSETKAIYGHWRIKTFFERVWLGLNFAKGYKNRLRLAESLSTMNDAQLRDIGLRRDQITAHVWRDRLK